MSKNLLDAVGVVVFPVEMLRASSPKGHDIKNPEDSNKNTFFLAQIVSLAIRAAGRKISAFFGESHKLIPRRL
jgi:hypothetical protein